MHDRIESKTDEQTRGSQELPTRDSSTQVAIDDLMEESSQHPSFAQLRPNHCQVEDQMEESGRDPPPSDSSTQLRPDLTSNTRGSRELSSDSNAQLSNSQELSSSDSNAQLSNSRLNLGKKSDSRTRRYIEIIVMCIVIAIIWGLFMLPVVFYYLSDNEVCIL